MFNVPRVEYSLIIQNYFRELISNPFSRISITPLKTAIRAFNHSS